uniref:Ig-like domain-containing protein n=1 Tax=Haplochromis burtoni TaxID=8153 RepID=A0A3Q2WJE1_HAPBU
MGLLHYSNFPICFSEKPGIPQQPFIISSTKDSCVVCWKPPSSDGGAKITNYYLEKREKKQNKWMSVTTKKIAETNYEVIGLIEGFEYEFRLRVSGVPPPTLKWQKDGHPLQFGPKVVVIQEDVDSHVLHIRETLLEDSGVYKVTATNSAGTASCQAKLSLPARILTKPQSVTVEEGETVRFTCDIDGEPAPTVTWIHESRTIVSSHHIQDLTTLIITGVKKEDAGSYTLKLSNELGSDTATVHISIRSV